MLELHLNRKHFLCSQQFIQDRLAQREDKLKCQQTGPPGCQELIRGVASPAVLCHKGPDRRIQSPILLAPRWFFMA